MRDPCFMTTLVLSYIYEKENSFQQLAFTLNPAENIMSINKTLTCTENRLALKSKRRNDGSLYSVLHILV